MWNGKAKEYRDGVLTFDGEYVNGKRWNGKGYDEFGNLALVMINGIGVGKEFYVNDNLFCIEGEYIDGKINGKGIEYGEYMASIQFEGEYLNGKRNGKGKENNENIFEGEYINGKRNGIGKEYYDDFIFKRKKMEWQRKRI